jgi:hypothetical protein
VRIAKSFAANPQRVASEEEAFKSMGAIVDIRRFATGWAAIRRRKSVIWNRPISVVRADASGPRILPTSPKLAEETMTYQSIEVRKPTPTIGAEIFGQAAGAERSEVKRPTVLARKAAHVRNGGVDQMIDEAHAARQREHLVGQPIPSLARDAGGITQCDHQSV